MDERYTFLEKIGEGGWAEVWRAKDSHLRRTVAVKLFRPDDCDISGARDHAQALARVSDANVVTIYDLCTFPHPEDGEVCEAIVMELLDGRTLTKLLEEACPGSIEADTVARGILRGLVALHKGKVAHSDMWGNNVMITTSGKPKLLDALYQGTMAAQKDNGAAKYRTDVRHAADLIGRVLNWSGRPHLAAQFALQVAKADTARLALGVFEGLLSPPEGRAASSALAAGVTWDEGRAILRIREAVTIDVLEQLVYAHPHMKKLMVRVELGLLIFQDEWAAALPMLEELFIEDDVQQWPVKFSAKIWRVCISVGTGTCPAFLMQLPELRDLTLRTADNAVLSSSYGELSQLQQLSILVKGELVVPYAIARLSRLERLTVEAPRDRPGCQVLLPSQALKLRVLIHLAFKNVRLTGIENVRADDLQTCHIEGCGLRNVPVFLRECRDLGQVGLQGNDIREIPSWLEQAKKLNAVNLRDNPELTASAVQEIDWGIAKLQFDDEDTRAALRVLRRCRRVVEIVFPRQKYDGSRTRRLSPRASRLYSAAWGAHQGASGLVPKYRSPKVLNSTLEGALSQVELNLNRVDISLQNDRLFGASYDDAYFRRLAPAEQEDLIGLVRWFAAREESSKGSRQLGSA